MVRGIARGWRVAVVQFVKSGKWHVGEEKVGRQLGVDWFAVGDGFTWDSDDLEHDRALAREGWGSGRRAAGVRRPRAGDPRRADVPLHLGLARHGRRRGGDPRPARSTSTSSSPGATRPPSSSTSPTPSPRCARSSTPTSRASAPCGASTSDVDAPARRSPQRQERAGRRDRPAPRRAGDVRRHVASRSTATSPRASPATARERPAWPTIEEPLDLAGALRRRRRRASSSSTASRCG